MLMVTVKADMRLQITAQQAYLYSQTMEMEHSPPKQTTPREINHKQ